MGNKDRHALSAQLESVEDAVAALGDQLGEMGAALLALAGDGDAMDLRNKWKAIVSKLVDLTLAADQIAAE